MTGKEIRLEKLFSNGENAVVVAADHGEFDGPIPGMIDLPETMSKVDSVVDAVLLAPGMISHCAKAFSYRGAPMIMARANWSSHFCFHWNYEEAIAVPATSIADLAISGVDLTLICLTLKTGTEATDASNVEVFCGLAAEAKKAGIPVVGEYFPARPDRLDNKQLHDEVMRGSRILAELGSDLIKTYYTEHFEDVTAGCPIPILGLGAEKTPKQIQALELAERIVQKGGRGVVFGRNALQVANPVAFQRALADVVKKGISAADAVKKNELVD